MPLTDLVIQKADVRVSINGGDMAAAHASQGVGDAGAPHDEGGYYGVSFDTTDTSVLGRLIIAVSKAGALPVRESFMVLPDRSDVWGTVTGEGEIEFPYTLTSSVDGAPIADALVWVTSDAVGENVIGSGRTDQNGLVTFHLDAGTVYVWHKKSGWDFPDDPDVEEVTA